MKQRLQNGFTLIELMIVIAVISILMAIAMPQYSEYIMKSKLAEAYSNLSTMQLRMEQYYQDNRLYQNKNVGGANFPVNCVASGATSQSYTCTAVNTSLGFTFTVDETGARSTTIDPTKSDWQGTGSACWVKTKAGSC